MPWKKYGVRSSAGNSLDLGESIILAKDVIQVPSSVERLELVEDPITINSGTYVTEISTGRTYLWSEPNWIEVTGNTVFQPLPDVGQLPGIGFLHRNFADGWDLRTSARSGSGW